MLGYNTNGFACHSLADAIKIIAGLGYKCAALTLDHHSLNPFKKHFEDDLREIWELLNTYKLESVIETGARFLLDPWNKHNPTLVCADESGRAFRKHFLKLAVDIAAVLKSQSVSFWAGKKDPDTDQAEAWEWLVQGCRELSWYAGERGVTLAFEPEPGMFVENLDQYRALKEEVGCENFLLTMDLGHVFLTEKESVGACVKSFVGDIKNMHIEDMKSGVHEHLFFGEGEMDFPNILLAIKESGYSGPLCVELSRHSHDAVNAARKAKEFLDRLMNG